MEKLNEEEKELVHTAFEALIQRSRHSIEDIRKFKWLCLDYLPQSGPGYEANINVFEIEKKTITDIEIKIKEAQELRNKILNY